MIGVFSDSHGDLGAFDAAYEFLKAKGAKRYFFLGGRYTDVDEWVLQRRERARGGRTYGDSDFLADVSSFLASQEQLTAGRASPSEQDEESIEQMRDRFARTPERGCLQYLDPSIDKKRVDMIGDVLCCLVHDKNDLTKEDLLNAQIFVHGRESEPKVVQIGPRFFVTPGKLTGAAEQTCGLLVQKDRELVFSAFTLGGRALIEGQSLAVGARTKLSVKS